MYSVLSTEYNKSDDFRPRSRSMRCPNSLFAAAALSLVLSAQAAEPDVTPSILKAAIEKSLPLLMKGALGHRENRTCFACHNQGVPLLALTAARSRGFKIDEDELKQQTAFIARFLDGNRENY